MNVEELLKSLSLEEKASITSGGAFWFSQEISDKLPAIMMTDGPHGLRKQEEDVDMLGINASVPATCFPSSATVCNSWDEGLMEEIGKALGEECQSHNVQVLLGPGANIKRSPLCGRNFEYFSEDPYLSSHMAAGHIRGVQGMGVGACIKHFAANNQETRRFTVNSEVDERTLREIYLASFEEAVREAKPWMVMGAYNLLNGTHCCENEHLLHDILRDEWGYEGVVVSDWGAVNDPVKGIEATFDLHMPGPAPSADAQIVEAVKSGRLSEERLEETVRRILTLVQKGIEGRLENFNYDKEAHHALAVRAAAESAVLLKNEETVLPLRPSDKIAVIGGFAKNIRFQGGGSSHVNATKVVNLLEAIENLKPEATYTFARGFRIKRDEIDEEYVAEAMACANDADKIILNLGLPYRIESEGFDRKDMKLPENQTDLLNRLAALGKPIIVILYLGSAIEMPWIDQVSAVLAMYTGGQAVAEAAAELLYGDRIPSGKLSETWPVKLSDSPSALNYPRLDNAVYEEGIYVGYRYYDKKEMPVRFPFGYGLSYTTFRYDGLELSKEKVTDQEEVTVSLNVTNTGTVRGKEVVQLYVHDYESSVSRPVKELKGFAKVECEPGETRRVYFTLDKRSFAYYEEKISDWYVESGRFEIMVGASCTDIRLTASIEVTGTVDIPYVYTKDTPMGRLYADPKAAQVLAGMMAGMESGMTGDISPEEKEAMLNDEDNTTELAADSSMMADMPLRTLVDFSGGIMTEEQLQGIVAMLNK